MLAAKVGEDFFLLLENGGFKDSLFFPIFYFTLGIDVVWVGTGGRVNVSDHTTRVAAAQKSTACSTSKSKGNRVSMLFKKKLTRTFKEQNMVQYG